MNELPEITRFLSELPGFEDLDQEEIEKERRVAQTQCEEEGKPADRIPKIVEGMLEKKFFKEVVLNEQPFVKDQNVTVGDLVADFSGKTGEKIVIRRFVRYEA